MAASEKLRKLRRPAAVAGRLALPWAVLVMNGCQSQPVNLSPAERLELSRRASDLLLRATQSADPVVASNAIEALVEVAPDEGLPRFRAALRSEFPLLRFAGLKALGTLRDTQSRRAVQHCRSDPSPMVRLGAAFAMYRAGDTDAARVLVNGLNDSPDENTRAEAANLIGLLEEPRAIKHLRAALRVKANEQSMRVQTDIYSAMARLGDDQAVWWLHDRAKSVEPLSRLMAMQALVDLHVDVAAEIFEYHVSREEGYLTHRLIAARGLAKLGSAAGYDLAMQSTRFVGRDPDDPEQTMRVRSNAALVLGEIGDPRALGVLRELAENESDPRIQVAACYAICRITAH